MVLCFLKFACAFSCDLGDNEGCMLFPFESYDVALCCLFMTSRCGKNE